MVKKKLHKLPPHKTIRVFEGFAGYGGASFGLKRSGLNYKVVGKQTSMLPVRFTIDTVAYKNSNPNAKQLTIPRFTHVAYNRTYYLKNEIIVPID
jgi:hypothetical protein